MDMAKEVHRWTIELKVAAKNVLKPALKTEVLNYEEGEVLVHLGKTSYLFSLFQRKGVCHVRIAHGRDFTKVQLSSQPEKVIAFLAGDMVRNAR